MVMCYDLKSKRFTSFISLGVKIEEFGAKDWIVIDYVNTTGKCTIYSKNKKIKVRGVHILEVFDIIGRDSNIIFENFKLKKGQIYIGSDLKLYTKKEYDEWQNEYKPKSKKYLKPAELKEGYLYETKCGKKLIYIGKLYVQNFRYNNIDAKAKSLESLFLTKLKREYLFVDTKEKSSKMQLYKYDESFKIKDYAKKNFISKDDIKDIIKYIGENNKQTYSNKCFYIGSEKYKKLNLTINKFNLGYDELLSEYVDNYNYSFKSINNENTIVALADFKVSSITLDDIVNNQVKFIMFYTNKTYYYMRYRYFTAIDTSNKSHSIHDDEIKEMINEKRVFEINFKYE